MSKKSIGDNSLIHSLLEAKIEQTPETKVEEPQLQTPVEETPQPAPEPDYAEYEEEAIAAPVGSEVDFEEEVEAIEAEPEHQESRRKVTSKWAVRLYDKLQGLMSMYAYDRLNSPSDYLRQRDLLLQKVYAGTITEEERNALKHINEIADGFLHRRTTYHESVYMSQDLVEDINELVEDVLIVSRKEINPVWILVGLLLIQPTINMITAFSHRRIMNN